MGFIGVISRLIIHIHLPSFGFHGRGFVDMVMWHGLTRQVFLRGQGASVSREFRMTRQMWSYLTKSSANLMDFFRVSKHTVGQRWHMVI